MAKFKNSIEKGKYHIDKLIQKPIKPKKQRTRKIYHKLEWKKPNGTILIEYKPQTTINDLNKTKYKPKKQKIKYPRNWKKYFEARQNHWNDSIKLIHELIKMLNIKTYGSRRGRPPIPIKDKIFLCIQKVLRGVTYDSHAQLIELAYYKNYTTTIPRPHSVADFMNEIQLTPILERLVTMSALPVAHFEKSFSIDSTGISTFDKSQWIKIRLDYKKHRDYKKLHAISGNRTNIIVAARVTHGTQADSPMLTPLLDIAKEKFNIKWFCADKAYSSRANTQAVTEAGAVPFLMPKKNFKTRSKGFPAWNKMIRMFRKQESYFRQFYHKRSNVETSFAMIKRRISNSVSSKNSVAQINEALCLVIAHNILVLINSMYCDQLEIKFKN
ncbi:transposase [Candidatus Woesearchaeota archaeon]|jgi:transposase|nr:transposase [Candidatus Woesearchaeota archaeon]MBT7368310.1 transposase [Candidatus Woesearchaeota archaeon]